MSDTMKKYIRLSIWTVIILFLARCWLGWEEVKTVVDEKQALKCAYTFYGYAGEAIGLAAILLFVFNQWAWRVKPLNVLAGGMPVLAKYYNGTIKYKYNSQEQTTSARLSIKQTFLNISVRLETDESISNSINASIENVHNEMQLIYFFINEPRAELQERSAIHYGTATLRVTNPDTITGNYYTGRLTRGSMDFNAQRE